ncbi:HK97 gp10 family phage protein [Streptomyces cinereoruber]|uniref:HK97 gp10 family phage protein n=1 Tax=Streptomyces cinereoruber TaxID=67260 RepID=UPI003637468A
MTSRDLSPDELADQLEAVADRLSDSIGRAVEHTGMVGRGLIRAGASGRPGPMVRGPEGVNYRSSWKTVPSRIPYGAECTIGTSKPQGRRLEFGFQGPDSLGRVYNQPPFPHVGPAIPVIEQTLRTQIRHAVQEALG